MATHHRSRQLGPARNQLRTWNRATFIRSIQRGTITLNNQTSNTATVTAVDTAHAVLYYLGHTGGTVSVTSRDYAMAIVLTNSTTVTATITTAVAVAHVVSYELIEYWPGVIKSLQRGTVTGTVSPTTATITAVDLLKAQLVPLGFTTDSTLTPEGDTTSAYLVLTNSTTVTRTQDNQAGTSWVSPFQVVEWF